MLRSKARWYEFGKKNINYFYNLEKRNYWKKHITSLTSENDLILSDPESILEEKPNFYGKIYQSKQRGPENTPFAPFLNLKDLHFLIMLKLTNAKDS